MFSINRTHQCMFQKLMDCQIGRDNEVKAGKLSLAFFTRSEERGKLLVYFKSYFPYEVRVGFCSAISILYL